MMGLFGEMGIFRWPGKEERRRAMAVLEKIGMKELANKQISELSGGQQQRLFVGRALLSNAEIFFLDEPFSAIDLATETYLMEIFRELRALGKTVLIVHHDLKSVEKYFDDLVMLNLRLIAAGTCKEVFTRKNLSLMFGGTSSILEKALQLSEEVKEGVR
jgi:manganese/zinc/iron transport system ATP- binding protein